ncbi:predicted protein [Lichtheimia corymbifera JMRC:FSU:9682]|uniref:Uncharacterized protein n=1 Tax=Lichtheimia corymbifera JMRC:FSU:9682 TaxID=1263082 RepID=A0A068S3F9_9FUNG|nr:predicted protein [Lichtheimia corymbifera JMRC:FSU:9682]
MFKKTIYELSIFFGHLEFLCTGGFWGEWTSNELTTFLGSSIRGLPQSMKASNNTTNIFITATAQRSSSSTRLFREYGYMLASNSALGCHSSQFANSGFYPVNPLYTTITKPHRQQMVDRKTAEVYSNWHGEKGGYVRFVASGDFDQGIGNIFQKQHHNIQFASS